MQRINTFLWFNGQAEEAARFYTSIFPDSEITAITHYSKVVSEGSGMPEGMVMTVEFTLFGQQFVALNGGPEYQFNPSISLLVNCETQEEVDYYWSRLTEGGEGVACGWLTDKFGLSWQITPIELMELTKDPDQAKSDRAMKAMMDMVKIDMNEIRRAVEGTGNRG